jgi:hypothetical protein
MHFSDAVASASSRTGAHGPLTAPMLVGAASFLTLMGRSRRRGAAPCICAEGHHLVRRRPSRACQCS